MLTRRHTILGLSAALAAPLLASPALAARPQVFTNSSNVAASGYDVTAYFTAGEPVLGMAEFSAEWLGALWYFASAQSRDLFVANPEAYAPQYGGHCAYAASKGALASTVPEAWTIVENRLYLNYSLGVRSIWRKDISGNIALADGNWPSLHS